MPRPIRPSTSKATTPRRSWRSWRSLAFGTKVDQSAIYVEGISSITPADLAAADELGYRVKLLGVAMKTPKGIEQRVHPTMVRKDSAIAQVMGVTNAVTDRCRRHQSADAGRSRRRRRGDRLGGAVRHWRYRARRAHRAVRPADRAAYERAQGADAAARGRLLHPAAGARQAGHRGDHRHTAGRSRRFRWNRSCSGTIRTRCSEAKAAPSPLSSSPMRPAKMRVRKALAAVGRDRVISGTPQVIRIEKN